MVYIKCLMKIRYFIFFFEVKYMILNENEKIIKNIKATMAVEGNFLESQDVSLINQYLNNKITEEEGIDIIKKDIISKMNKRNV